MSLNAPLIAELQHEAVTTRKCLERLPETEFNWKPHEKSMTLGELAIHVAEMTGWVAETINKPEMNFATDYVRPPAITTTADLVAYFDQRAADAADALKSASDENLMQNWTLRSGDKILLSMPRIQALRGMVMNHIVHHRGQLSVYMRLKGISVPAIYGPSADEGAM